MLEGRPTTPEQIRTALEDLRVRFSAEELALFTISGRKLLRSVSFSTTNTAAGKALSTSLRHGETLSVAKSADALTELDAEGFVAFLRSQPALQKTMRRFRRTEVVFPSRPRPRAAATIRLLVVAGSSASTGLTRRVDQLEMMVNTTANVDVARDIQLSASVKGLGSRMPLANADLIEAHDIDALFRLVLDAIAADSIALYERSPDVDALQLVRATPSKLVSPIEGMRTSDTANVNSVSLSQRRPVFLVPGQTGLSTLQRGPADLHSAWSAEDSVYKTELAVPVPTAPLGRLGPTYGVLTVCRASAEEPPPHFSRYDLAVMRNLSLRVGYSVFLNRLISAQREIAALTVARTPSDASPPAMRVGEFRAWQGVSNGIPADLNAVRPSLQRLVASLAAATSASSCTLRLLLPGDGVHRKKRQWSLVRFVASPEQRINEPWPAIPIDHPSVHSWVGTVGGQCYLPDVRDGRMLKHYRGLHAPRTVRESTRSELCVPIAFSGRVIGTINLESPVVDAFAVHLGVVEQYAALAGQLIGAERARISEQILSFTSSVHNSAHEILQSLDTISLVLGSVSQSGRAGNVATEVATIERLLESDADPLAMYRADVQYPGCEILDVFEQVREEMNFEHLTLPTARSSLVIEAQRVPYVRFALTDVLASAQRHMSRAPGERARVEVFRRTFGGMSFADAVVYYETSDPVPPALVEQLYRIPLSTDTSGVNRPHLGSYSAGATMRAIGGELFFRVTGAVNVEIIACVPVLPEVVDA